MKHRADVLQIERPGGTQAGGRHAVAKAFFEIADKQRRSVGPAKGAAPQKRSMFKRG